MVLPVIRSWPSNLLKGLLALILGVLILINPSNALLALAFYFGIFAIIGGAIVLFYAYKSRGRGAYSTIRFLEGILDILIGLAIVSYPELSVQLFIVLFGIWSIFIGIIQLSAYSGFRSMNFNASLILVSGILSLLVGILLLLNPFESARVIAVIIGIYAVLYGLFSMVTAFKVSRQ